MAGAEVIDRIVTPLVFGAGTFVAARSSGDLRRLFRTMKILMVAGVVAIYGCLKWSNVI